MTEELPPGEEADGFAAPPAEFVVPPQYIPATPPAPAVSPAPAYPPPAGYGFPQPGGFPGQFAPLPPPAPRKRRGLLMGVIGAAAVLVVGAAGFGVTLALSSGSPKAPSAHPRIFRSASLETTITTPGGDSTGVAGFSPDGRLMAAEEDQGSGSSGGPAIFYVWNAATGSQVAMLPVPSGYDVDSFPVFSADDKTLTALCMSAGSTPLTAQVYQWTLRTGAVTSLFTGQTPVTNTDAAFFTTSISADGSRLSIEDSAGSSVDIWNLANDTLVTTVPMTGTGNPVAANLDYHGDKLLMADDSGFAGVYSVATSKQLAAFNYTYQAPTSNSGPNIPELAANGTRAYMYGQDTFTLWNAVTGKLITPSSPFWPTSGYPVISNDGLLLATAKDSSGTSLTFWNGATTSYLFSAKLPDNSGEYPVSVSPDDSEVVAIGWDETGGTQTGEVYIWHVH